MSSRRRNRDDADEQFTDDLAIAAEFAVVSFTQPTPTTAKAQEDENEIDLENDQDFGEDKLTKEALPIQPNNDNVVEKHAETTNDDNDDDDDDDSACDLDETVALMMHQEQNNASERPKTAHEIDLYSSEAVPPLLPPSARQLNRESLQPAGHVVQFVKADRTVVVAASGVILEEGTLLVVQLGGQVVPLGVILEVFGPVSQPLYSIRLPTVSSPVENGTSNSTTAISMGVNEQGTDATTAPPNVLDPAPPAESKLPCTTNGDSDPWADTSPNTLALCDTSKKIPVFYIDTEATLIDPKLIEAQSGRGCDASNVYDEEVNHQEMEYSDDEEERMAKKKGVSRSRPFPVAVASNNTNALQGFHRPTTVPPPAAPQLPPPPPPQPESDTVYYEY
jgi:hypothetical protein